MVKSLQKSSLGPIIVCSNDDKVDLDLFYSKVKFGILVQLMNKSFNSRNLQQMPSHKRFMYIQKTGGGGGGEEVCLFQVFSSLKPLGKSEPNYICEQNFGPSGKLRSMGGC